MREKEIKADVEQSSWNLSQALIQEIANLLRLSSSNYISGNYSKSFTALKAIKSRIIANLDEIEMKEFLALEKICKIAIIKFKTSKYDTSYSFGCPYDDETLKLAKQTDVDLIDTLDEYNMKIMVALKKYGYLIPPKDDLTQMSA